MHAAGRRVRIMLWHYRVDTLIVPPDAAIQCSRALESTILFSSVG